MKTVAALLALSLLALMRTCDTADYGGEVSKVTEIGHTYLCYDLTRWKIHSLRKIMDTLLDCSQGANAEGAKFTLTKPYVTVMTGDDFSLARFCKTIPDAVITLTPDDDDKLSVKVVSGHSYQMSVNYIPSYKEVFAELDAKLAAADMTVANKTEKLLTLTNDGWFVSYNVKKTTNSDTEEETSAEQSRP